MYKSVLHVQNDCFLYNLLIKPNAFLYFRYCSHRRILGHYKQYHRQIRISTFYLNGDTEKSFPNNLVSSTG